MYGEVGKAINNEINNSHNPIIVGLKNSYTLMGVDFQKTLSDFQSTVGENSESAILDEEVLTQTKTKMTNADTKHTEYETKIGKIYSDINDLISLSCPSSSVSSSITSANKILQDAINNVNKFDTADAPLQTDNIVTALGKQIEVGNQAQALSYTDPRFVDFAAFFAVLADDFRQFAEGDDAVPFGFLAALARVAVLPLRGGGHRDVGDGRTLGRVADFRVAAQIAHQDDFVDGCHERTPEIRNRPQDRETVQRQAVIVDKDSLGGHRRKATPG